MPDQPEEPYDAVEEMSAVLDLVADFVEHGDFVSVVTGASSTATTGRHPMLEAPIRIKMMPHAEGLELPEYKSILASGVDLSAAIEGLIHLNSIGATAMIPTGICVEIPPGYEGQIRPRSGLAAKHGITVTNTPGTIDADYRGEIKVSLTKINMSGGRFSVERGMRIAQLVICPVVQATFELVDDLSKTERGTNGFGSTGVI